MHNQRWIVCLTALLIAFGAGASYALDNVTPTAQPTTTPVGETITYTVQRGDTLGLIASRFGVRGSAIAQLNNLANPEFIVIGQKLLIPVAPTALPPTPTSAAPIPTGESPAELPDAPELTPEVPVLDFDYGIEIFADGSPNRAADITQLGMRWAKITVSWRSLETTPGALDFTTTDTLIDALTAQGTKILLTLTHAPDWARSTTVENGPPDDYAAFASFAGTVAARYSRRVAAYEIWNEPNLRREWNSTARPVSADAYADLLRVAYSAIKNVDADALVISAGLAPTGFDDGVNAINDRAYLQALYRAGLTAFSDGIGVHPYGYANPPDTVCCDALPDVPTHYGHPSFYFLDTLDDYRAIMLANGDFETRLWVTRFGWGTGDGSAAPPRNSRYVSYTSADEQAEYLVRAFELGVTLDYVQLMIAYNLNGCTAALADAEACYYSLIDETGMPRPAYERLSLIFTDADSP